MKRERAINGLFACPCCGYATLGDAGRYHICAICFWEDDGQDDPEENECWGGPNYVTLTEGRVNFLQLGVSDPKDKSHVREPAPSDINIRKYTLRNGRAVSATIIHNPGNKHGVGE
ncbi:hypothetical protein KUV44_02690 [Marinobacter daepoensis]|uniref:Cysteine-rich CPCC domain-containing protein n=1 Tax=Marinobacter daepoensis TaxID=262077 RepID=A0ABS3BBW9_9GAMM|nr:CPCC family cysteine-rich protein [Marinobacter daepoensis]MBN7769350.1 hypothetical protein [Marinobacter daepoensis]MBY6031988.1 hypothetical protein [Marinobacter daepoensis]MBY6078040.1 hypothetical protein [Marinobacter daepoensis]